MFKIEVKTNGYENYQSEELKRMVQIFNEEVQNRFYDYNGVIEHFYYGERLVMTTVRFSNKNYGQFNITANRVSFNGFTCSTLEKAIFESLTYNDELFAGSLIK